MSLPVCLSMLPWHAQPRFDRFEKECQDIKGKLAKKICAELVPSHQEKMAIRALMQDISKQALASHKALVALSNKLKQRNTTPDEVMEKVVGMRNRFNNLTVLINGTYFLRRVDANKMLSIIPDIDEHFGIPKVIRAIVHREHANDLIRFEQLQELATSMKQFRELIGVQNTKQLHYHNESILESGMIRILQAPPAKPTVNDIKGDLTKLSELCKFAADCFPEGLFQAASFKDIDMLLRLCTDTDVEQQEQAVTHFQQLTADKQYSGLLQSILVLPYWTTLFDYVVQSMTEKKKHDGKKGVIMKACKLLDQAMDVNTPFVAVNASHVVALLKAGVNAAADDEPGSAGINLIFQFISNAERFA